MSPKRRTNSIQPPESAAPLPRGSKRDRSGDSELDEYIHLGEEEEEEDLFDDMPEEEEEDDGAPLPRIARDEKLEQEIERERYVPIEKLIENVPDLGQSLDPVRMYLRDIVRHALLTAEQ